MKNVSLNAKTLHYFKACFEENGSPKTHEKIQWEYLHDRSTNDLVDILVDDQDVAAAIYAMSERNFLIDGQVCKGLQSMDTMTDHRFRGKGFFITLAKKAYKNASENGYHLVYGIPNSASNPGFTRKLEWKNHDPVPFLIKPLRSQYFTQRISWLKWLPNLPMSLLPYRPDPTLKIVENADFPTEIDDVWNRFSGEVKVAIHRNREYLLWRYVQKPHVEYRFLHCYRDDNYLGSVVFTVENKHGGKIGYIMELLFAPANAQVGNELLKNAVAQIRKQGADCVLAWCFDHSPNYGCFRSSRFVKLPEKLRPIELHFGYRALDAKCADVLAKKENWYLSYSDSDTV